ncbi:MAG: NADH-quinone oxidoreductase subunit F [SAR202 cluster bacterium]|jgi:NADH:ubiquinone oxidoreductase subunit F (NADH-binding)|nr:NADH-quinone oxidoreductase subunit F [Chloroflexota bacterium]MQF83938.1 NADH-quinone oxidoreductase subunit F [SAR202 cluster bacterium]MEC7920138.1 NADH-ubiquinone oxidoreductase-F iron-sulfur binding region domain-containing protein [Chloroflexota bacterium]MEC9099551.1 NADH-ubiquinone oxidoreductase-F iron-sulfur binding region domain-containing protein [Chloroflexota bacterium]MQG20015.1 NADH-quinone oxidoreductase subunit F [SAR202 cluster bacterium]|tara:strand:+ start:1862 stop:3565 length:1704 start_codon:yes stop_codon:yes gene_type:complete
MSEQYKKLEELSKDYLSKIYKDKTVIRVQTGTSGQAVGADEILKLLSSKTNNKINVIEVGSMGLMYLEPILVVVMPTGEKIYYANVDLKTSEKIYDHYSNSQEVLLQNAFAYESSKNLDISIPNINDLPQFSKQLRIATRNFGEITPGDIMQYISTGGYSALNKALFEMSPEEVVEEVKSSGLRGRGGAAFPTGVKWSFLAPNKAPIKYVLCNCEEGDPGAYNDKGILETDPHTLVEGLILNGYATNSNKSYVFIRQGHDIPINAIERAIKEAYDKGLLGENILGSNFSFDMEVSLTGDSYVAGEETALMEAIEGKRSTPRFKPPFPAAAGLWQKPTNINNVKTISYVPQIIKNGSDWFSSTGTEKSSGTAIVCLSGHITRPGMYEIPMGMTIEEVLDEVGGGSNSDSDIKMLQTGGPLGGVLGKEAFGTKIDFDEMAKSGAILGSGGIIVCNETVSVVDLIRNLVAFNQFESCGKCFPCRLGNTHMFDVLQRLADSESNPGDMELLERIGKSMKIGSLCGHGQLGYNPISSSLKYFESEIIDSMNNKSEPLEAMLTPTRTRPNSAE